MRVLLVKMSSLGDVVHTLPGLSDAAEAFGGNGVCFDWVVEEAFESVAARHPAVSTVIPVAWRRWRRTLGASRGQMRQFLRRLRQRRYDLVLDAQGLMKSAAVTALARGRVKAGLAYRSAREGPAALFYGRRLPVSRDAHAVDRIRALFSAALGYPAADGPPDFGISAGASEASSRAPYCLLLHGTTWHSKLYPPPLWEEIARRADDAGLQVLVPFGGPDERRRAEAIAAAAPARVLEPLTLGELTELLAGAALVIGVDSGLAQLAAALAVPTVVLFGSTDSTLTGVRGARACNLQAQFPCSPCLSRVCGYRGSQRRWGDQVVVPPCYVRLDPDTVWQAARQLTAGGHDADRLLHL